MKSKDHYLKEKRTKKKAFFGGGVPVKQGGTQ
jgi:hypothetical protein